MSRSLPDLEARDFRALLHRAAEIAARHWERLPEMRAYTRPPDDVVASLCAEPLPQAAKPLEEILDRIEREIVPYPIGIGQRRWWGFINSSPHPLGIAADLVATTLNNNCAGTSQIAVHVELKVIEWLAELLGLPRGTGGLLVSGGSMANLVALAAAREAKLPGTRGRGLHALARAPAVYASSEAHSCIRRAVELLGLGTDALRLVPADEEYRMDVAALERMIAADRAAGLQPIALVASAGTVNTGVVDPIAEIADVAEANGCWLHVDGAYGAVGAALPELAPRYRGIERADSVAMDPHKWLYVPYEAGATLVRDPATLRAMFALRPDYLAVRNDIAVAHEIARLARAHPRLEVLASSDLSCFAFRYVPRRGEGGAGANPFNRKLLDRTHRDGRMFITGTVLDGKFALRGCVTNFRSTLEDAQVCVETVVELGEALEAEEDAV